MTELRYWNGEDWVPEDEEFWRSLQPDRPAPAVMCPRCCWPGVVRFSKLGKPRVTHQSRGRPCPDGGNPWILPPPEDWRPLPLRLVPRGEGFELEIGIPSIPEDLRPSCRGGTLILRSSGGWERKVTLPLENFFSQEDYVYVNVGNRPSERYDLEVEDPSGRLQGFYPEKVAGFHHDGTLFDGGTMLKLATGTRVRAEGTYYLLRRGLIKDVPPDVECDCVAALAQMDGTWYLYRCHAGVHSGEAAAFFVIQGVLFSRHPQDPHPAPYVPGAPEQPGSSAGGDSRPATDLDQERKNLREQSERTRQKQGWRPDPGTPDWRRPGWLEDPVALAREEDRQQKLRDLGEQIERARQEQDALEQKAALARQEEGESSDPSAEREADLRERRRRDLEDLGKQIERARQEQESQEQQEKARRFASRREAETWEKGAAQREERSTETLPELLPFSPQFSFSRKADTPPAREEVPSLLIRNLPETEPEDHPEQQPRTWESEKNKTEEAQGDSLHSAPQGQENPETGFVESGPEEEAARVGTDLEEAPSAPAADSVPGAAVPETAEEEPEPVPLPQEESPREMEPVTSDEVPAPREERGESSPDPAPQGAESAAPEAGAPHEPEPEAVSREPDSMPAAVEPPEKELSFPLEDGIRVPQGDTPQPEQSQPEPTQVEVSRPETPPEEEHPASEASHLRRRRKAGALPSAPAGSGEERGAETKSVSPQAASPSGAGESSSPLGETRDRPAAQESKPALETVSTEDLNLEDVEAEIGALTRKLERLKEERAELEWQREHENRWKNPPPSSAAKAGKKKTPAPEQPQERGKPSSQEPDRWNSGLRSYGRVAPEEGPRRGSALQSYGRAVAQPGGRSAPLSGEKLPEPGTDTLPAGGAASDSHSERDSLPERRRDSSSSGGVFPTGPRPASPSEGTPEGSGRPRSTPPRASLPAAPRSGSSGAPQDLSPQAPSWSLRPGSVTDGGKKGPTISAHHLRDADVNEIFEQYRPDVTPFESASPADPEAPVVRRRRGRPRKVRPESEPEPERPFMELIPKGSEPSPRAKVTLEQAAAPAQEEEKSPPEPRSPARPDPERNTGTRTGPQFMWRTTAAPAGKTPEPEPQTRQPLSRPESRPQESPVPRETLRTRQETPAPRETLRSRPEPQVPQETPPAREELPGFREMAREAQDKQILAYLQAGRGRLMPVPHALGGVLAGLGDYPRTRQWLSQRIREGTMTETAYGRVRALQESLARRRRNLWTTLPY